MSRDDIDNRGRWDTIEDVEPAKFKFTHPESAREHLRIIDQRLVMLDEEFQRADAEINEIELKRLDFESRFNLTKSDIEKKVHDSRKDLKSKVANYAHQVDTLSELLEKKRSERVFLLTRLLETKVLSNTHLDWIDFGWDSLQRMAHRGKNADSIEEQKKKASMLSNLCSRFRVKFNELSTVHREIKELRRRVLCQMDEVQECKNRWIALRGVQANKILRLESEHTKLSLLLRTCLLNEPKSDYLTKNIRAKCQAFMSCADSQDLLDGLRKFVERQNKIIKLLRHKDSNMSRDISKLQVAKDQTADQMQYYTNVINRKQNRNPPTIELY